MKRKADMRIPVNSRAKASLGVALAGAGLLALSLRPEPVHSASEPSRPAVEAVHPRHMPLAHRVDTNATLEAFETADLYAKVAGFVSEVRSDIGDHVKRGQVLAVIDIPELRGELGEAKAQLEARRADMELQAATLKRNEALFADKAITEQGLDEIRTKAALAKAQYGVASAAVDRLMALVGYSQVTAPFDGLVARRIVNRGDLVQAATASRTALLFTVQRVDTMRVFCEVPENDAARVAVGDPVTIKPAGLAKSFTGKVARFARRLDPDSHNMRTEVDLPNPDEQLYSGMYAQISIEMKRKPDAFAVPASAVGNDAKGSFVYVIDNDQIARKDVKTGLSDQGWIEVTDGLGDDAIVVATARGAPGPGTAVTASLRQNAK